MVEYFLLRGLWDVVGLLVVSAFVKMHAWTWQHLIFIWENTFACLLRSKTASAKLLPEAVVHARISVEGVSMSKEQGVSMSKEQRVLW